MPHLFTGPVVLETRPFRSSELWSRLVQQIPYGLTVWCDSGGAWHQQYAPTLDQLEGATAVYAGGRTHALTPTQAAVLSAAGFGAYIEVTPGPAFADDALADDPASIAT